MSEPRETGPDLSVREMVARAARNGNTVGLSRGQTVVLNEVLELTADLARHVATYADDPARRMERDAMLLRAAKYGLLPPGWSRERAERHAGHGGGL